MKSLLPATGTRDLLDLLSPHVPDDWINRTFPPLKGAGRRRRFSAAQLFRVHLLAVLSPVHSFNLLARMLSEQRAWRRFAHLPNRFALPEPCMLHEFRERLGVQGFRCINEHLATPLLPPPGTGILSVALIDATDLPASARGFKKRIPNNTRLSARPWVPGRSRRVRAGSSWATRNIPSVCGSRVMNGACC